MMVSMGRVGKIALAIHGGANAGSEYLDDNIDLYKDGLERAIIAGYKVLMEGRSAIEAVQAAVIVMEDNPIFNAGVGSALNENGEIQMEAVIMDGKYLHSGSVAIVNQIKNPITLAKAVMENSNYAMIAGKAAIDYAVNHGMMPVSSDYCITERQRNNFIKSEAARTYGLPVNGKKKAYGTVGAVALDQHGNTAAATSTGGPSLAHDGRIGDSSIIGAGCYADNNSCAISATGQSEYLIRLVVAHDVAAMVEYGRKSLQEACDYKIHEKHKDVPVEMGVIGVDPLGNISFSFNTKCMCRASISNRQPLYMAIY
jgi:L-asparaginase / beta-aspartyl-peptidase